MKNFNVLGGLFVFGLAACEGTIPGGTTLEPPTEENPECVALTSCSDMSELIGLLTPLLPRGEQGSPGQDGAPGATVEEVLASVLPLLPQGEKGDQGDVGPMGPAGSDGQSVSLSDVVDAVLPLVPAGPTGSVGATGATGANGVGFSNTSVLSAVRVFSPAMQDYVGSTTVNTSAMFVPSVLNVVVGDQKDGLAYVSFGTTICTYTGNSKSGSALAMYEFTSCSDSSGNPMPDKQPGVPFAFTGTITLQVGDGSGTVSPVQIVSFFQIM